VWDLSGSQRDLGFRTTPIARWIRENVDWYRDNQQDDPRPPSAQRAGFDGLVGGFPPPAGPAT